MAYQTVQSTTLRAADSTPSSPCGHARLNAWVAQIAALAEPDAIRWCDGSDAEWREMTDLLVEAGTFVRLNPAKRPDSFYARSDPKDVARVETRTYICSEAAEGAGPTNNWADPAEMRTTLKGLFKGAMRGRTLYVVPFCMGPVGSPASIVGVELTDSPYVVVSMRLMTRMGSAALEAPGSGRRVRARRPHRRRAAASRPGGCGVAVQRD